MARLVDPRRIEVIDDTVAAILRAKSPDERLAMAFECHEMGRAILRTQIASAHSDWTPKQIQAEVARRMACEPS